MAFSESRGYNVEIRPGDRKAWDLGNILTLSSCTVFIRRVSGSSRVTRIYTQVLYTSTLDRSGVTRGAVRISINDVGRMRC